MNKLGCIILTNNLEKLNRTLEEISKQSLNLENGLETIITTQDKKVADAVQRHKSISVVFFDNSSINKLIIRARRRLKSKQFFIIDDSFYSEEKTLFENMRQVIQTEDYNTIKFINERIPGIVSRLRTTENVLLENISIRIIEYLMRKNIAKIIRNSFSDLEKECIDDNMKSLASEIKWETFYDNAITNIAQLCYLFKINKKLKDHRYTFSNGWLCNHDIPIVNLKSKRGCKVEIIDIEGDCISLEGVEAYSSIPNLQLVAVDNVGTMHYADCETPWMHTAVNGFNGEEIFAGSRFRLAIPKKGIESFKLACTLDNKLIEIKPSFGVFSHIDPQNPGAYFHAGDTLLKYKKGKFLVSNKTIGKLVKAEIVFLNTLRKKHRFDLIRLRVQFFVLHALSFKERWILRDNEDRAKDSSIELFKYISENKKSIPQLKNVKSKFILTSKSEDYKIASQYGKVIEPFTRQYKLEMMLSNKVIDTRGGISSKYIFGQDEAVFRNLCKWEYIWLVHGVISRNESTWTNKFVLNAKLYITSGEKEFDSILDKNNCYGYKDDEVVLTGLPRLDTLKNQAEKLVVFMPTWRKKIAGKIIPGTSEREYVKDFKNTEFCRFYNSLINDERLLKIMEQYGYKGVFYLHPSFIKQTNDMEGNQIIKIGKSAANATELVSKCSILITDYSSVEFDAAYLNKPVVYTQYDYKTFSDEHTGNKGYFDHQRDGFGPICNNIDETVECIIDLIKNNCSMPSIYRERTKNFFSFNDNKNSERVLNAILHKEGIV